MSGDTDLSFTTDGLRHGGGQAAATADAAGVVAGLIVGMAVDPAAFGRLESATALGADLTAFRDGMGELARHVQAAHTALAGRAAGTAGSGDQMVSDTSAVAGSVPAPAGSAG